MVSNLILLPWLVLFIYGQTRFVIDRNLRQNIFLGRDYGMPYTSNKTKQNFLDHSFHLSMQAQSKYPQEKLKSTKKNKKYGRSFDQIQVKARNWTLIGFIFSHKLWFLSWSFIRHNIHVWSQNTFFMARNPRQKLFLEVNMWAICDI